MNALRIGLIGTGYMGKCHALAWNAVAPVFGDIERPRLAMLGEADEALAARRARELGFERATGDWRRLVADPGIDVISITTPNALHAEMAIAALKAGKHVWCEKPMAPSLAEAEAMHAAWRASGKVAVLGYNYIQNPLIRHIKATIDDGTIGTVNHVRIEMDEDFMADAATPVTPRSAASSGYGALDDFGVHALSLLFTLFGHVRRVFADMAKPYADRPLAAGGRRAVENHDAATMLADVEGGVRAVVQLNRAAWGRKGRIAVQIFGSKGAIVYDQERMNEAQLYVAEGPVVQQGYRTLLAGPAHKPYDRFIPAPGHSLGFNELKVIECRQLIARIAGETSVLIDFDDGLRMERALHAAAESFRAGRWIDVG